ncbi:hypothetical protein [Bradyrhizobium sp. th.b2]|uniref:hypothetical protein n=1 Tax=Bradyrhizobium sp. th-b2 TaxID=172088 RepID=UPI000686F140|nr:hypothetical protein [Bradyrhizobium sp. th.b2]
MSDRPSRFARPELTEETPITLQEACDLYFRGIITEVSLRAEHARGMLTIFRVGRQDFTTLRFVREMQERKCRANPEAPAARSPSAAEREAACAALRATIQRMKNSAPRIRPRKIKLQPRSTQSSE